MLNDDLITSVTGNLFAAMGSSNAEEMWVKSQLIHVIYREVEERKLSKKKAARFLGLKKKRVTQLFRGRVREFSTYELMELVRYLGYKVEITIEPLNEQLEPLRINLAEAAEYSIMCWRTGSDGTH